MNTCSKYYFGCIIVGISLLYQSCIEGENPYEDIGDARIAITHDSRLQDGDSVYADKNHQYELKLALFLKEFISSFEVRVGGVTTLTDTTVVVTEKMDNPFSLNLQFSDSGQIPITIVTYYEDGSEKGQGISVYGIITVDNKPPLIKILNEGLQGNDLFSDSIPLTLRVKVWDTENQVDTGSLRINNIIFDSLDTDVPTEVVCYATFSEEDFTNLPIVIRIVAEDMLQNSKIDTFRIYRGASDPAFLVRTKPDGDTLETDSDTIQVEGYVDSITVDKLFYCIRIFLNNSLLSIGSYPSLTNNSWLFDLQLTETWNTIQFVLYHKDEAPQNPLDTSVLVVNCQELTKSTRCVVPEDPDEVLANGILHPVYPGSRQKAGGVYEDE